MLAEGTDIRFHKAAEADADATACSARHLEIMERIMSGTYRKPISLSSPRIKIAAAIAAAMLLLSGCVMIYKDEIRDFIEHIYEEYIEISFSDGENTESSSVEEIYELTYVPTTEFCSGMAIIGEPAYCTRCGQRLNTSIGIVSTKTEEAILTITKKEEDTQ